MEYSIEQLEQTPRFQSFIKKLAVYCGGTSLLDGYILSSIGPAMVQLGPLLNLDAFWKGAIGSGALMGILIGGPIFGSLSDRVGRKLPFIVIPICMAVLTLASMFVTSPEQLFVIRFLLGLVIGSDYPSATAYLSEYSPAKSRGYMIGYLMIMWISGMTLGEIVGYVVYNSVYSWQICLGLPAIFAILLALGRRSCPESPRWLVNKNRRDEAVAIMKSVYGPEVAVNSLEETSTAKASYSELFTPKYLKRVLFAGIFWATQVLPMFAIYIFAPALLQSMGLSEGRDGALGSILIGLIFVVGVVFGAAIIEKFGRRPLIIVSFVGMAVGLLVLGILPDTPFWLIVFGFTLYAIASGPPNVLDWVYPNELFPTEIRAAGVGTATMISRTGPILGTFALPTFLEMYGIQMTMLAMVGVLVIGLLACIAWAPETRGLDLAEASGAVPVGTQKEIEEELIVENEEGTSKDR